MGSFSLAVRDLVLVVVALVGLSRLVDPPAAWAAAGLLVGATLVGALQVFGEAEAAGQPAGDASGVPIESLLLPAVAAFACLGTIHLVPIGLALVPFLASAWALVTFVVRTEGRIALAAEVSHGDRTLILTAAMVLAFLAFVAVAALVPGGLAERAAGAGGGVAGEPLIGGNLAILVGGDAVVAGLIGYRIAALRLTHLADVAWSAASYAVVAAISSIATGAIGIPRLVGPGVLVLVLFLWDAVHGAPPALRRERRRVIEAAVLAVLGGAVLVWSLNVRP